MSDNLTVYNAVRQPPPEALKAIGGGRLKGMTDINPMWRMKALTEQFGMCGIGWKYVITKQWLETGGKDEQAAFVNIDLFIKVEGTWSDAIPGTGGSSFVAAEKSGLYTSDECFKMALTDAISVSCKALGFAADIYWDKDNTKYNNGRAETPPQTTQPPQGGSQPNVLPFGTAGQQPTPQGVCAECKKPIGPGVISFCKQNKIEPPTCMNCRKVAIGGN